MTDNKFILFTDIDGTLLDEEKKISWQNVSALKKLNNTYRVAISGRNLISARRVLPPDLPIDYLVFSNGAGIQNWNTEKIIYKKHLDKNLLKDLVYFLIQKRITFTLHRSIPLMHYYWYHLGNYIPEDLYQRNYYYKDFVSPFDYKIIDSLKEATCIICMLSSDLEMFKSLSEDLKRFENQISITRTTSPFTHKHIWLEIYHKDVNKGLTARFLTDLLYVPYNNTIGVGNDYNDFSLLEFVKYPFVVDNAPDDLKKIFPTTVHHNHHAIADVIKIMGLK